MGQYFPIQPLKVNLGTTQFMPRKSPSTHWIGGWVGLGANLDVLEKRKNLLPLPEFEPQTVQFVAKYNNLIYSHFTCR
jgi:hypothetical protein